MPSDDKAIDRLLCDIGDDLADGEDIAFAKIQMAISACTGDRNAALLELQKLRDKWLREGKLSLAYDCTRLMLDYFRQAHNVSAIAYEAKVLLDFVDSGRMPLVVKAMAKYFEPTAEEIDVTSKSLIEGIRRCIRAGKEEAWCYFESDLHKNNEPETVSLSSFLETQMGAMIASQEVSTRISEFHLRHFRYPVLPADGRSQLRKLNDDERELLSKLIDRIPDIRDGLIPLERSLLLLIYNSGAKCSAHYASEQLANKSKAFSVQEIERIIESNSSAECCRYPLLHLNEDGTMLELSDIAKTLLQELHFNCVEVEADGAPTVLPSQIPLILANGRMGTIADFTCTIPPHNLAELLDATIAILEDPNLSDQALLSLIKGPDFAAGETIIGIQELHEAYGYGRGSVAVGNKSGNGEAETQIDINFTAMALAEGEAHQLLGSPKAKNSLGVRAIRPLSASLRHFLSAFIDHRKEVVESCVRYLQSRNELILAINEGLLRVGFEFQKFWTADEKTHLVSINQIDHLKLTNLQTDWICKMQLAEILDLNLDMLKQDVSALRAQIKIYDSILQNSNGITSIITGQLREMQKRFGDQRRTRIVENKRGRIEEDP